MSFRYFPHAILFAATFIFLMKGIMIYAEEKFRIPFTNNKFLLAKKARLVAIIYFILALICAWDFIYIIITGKF